MIKTLCRSVLNNLGLEVFKTNNPYFYNQDGLRTCHDFSFLKDPKFISAYQRGIKSQGKDLMIHWRVHTALWAASLSSKLSGVYVECGVNKGFLSSAIMDYLNWNILDKEFYLFDTYKGLDSSLSTDVELKRKNLDYIECYEEVKQNFSEYKNVHLVRGLVPDSLTSVDIEKVCYLSIDMNCAAPEIAAAKFFWPKLVKGAVILLDDYAHHGYTPQKLAFDKFSEEYKVPILSLPTGQGLIIKN